MEFLGNSFLSKDFNLKFGGIFIEFLIKYFMYIFRFLGGKSLLKHFGNILGHFGVVLKGVLDFNTIFGNVLDFLANLGGSFTFLKYLITLKEIFQDLQNFQRKLSSYQALLTEQISTNWPKHSKCSRKKKCVLYSHNINFW